MIERQSSNREEEGDSPPAVYASHTCRARPEDPCGWQDYKHLGLLLLAPERMSRKLSGKQSRTPSQALRYRVLVSPAVFSPALPPTQPPKTMFLDGEDEHKWIHLDENEKCGCAFRYRKDRGEWN